MGFMLRHVLGYFLIMFLILSTVTLSGCSDIEDDMESQIMSEIPIIGWFHRLHSTPTQITGNVIDNTTDDSQNYNSKLPKIPKDTRCDEHQYWNTQYNTCACESNYYMQDGVCLLKSSRECVVDRDCSPNGQLSVCADTTSKKAYYCDLNTYKCVGGKGNGVLVDCKIEYGSKYRCVNGDCVE